MKFSYASVLSLLSLAFGESTDGYITMPILTKNSSTGSAFSKRSSSAVTSPVSATNYITAYIATVELGTPGQELSVIIDSASSDLWVWGAGTGAPQTYDSSKSSGAKYVNDGFNIGYVGGAAAIGDYYNDQFTWGDISLPVQFGVSHINWKSGDLGQGVLGLSLKNIEGSKDGEYDNLPYAMKNQGLINTVAYSLYLDDYSSPTGTLLFGAVDQSRYTGKLTTLDIIGDSFTVDVTVDGTQVQANLDSGTSLIYLPPSIINNLVNNQFKGLVTYDSSMGLYRLNSDTPPTETVTFTFNDVDITLGEELWVKLAHNSYYLVIGSSDLTGVVLLGDCFLRSAYVVYDLENKKLAIAKASYNDDAPNYQTIVDGVIPGAE